jgi:uncharacterized protein YjiS (DUF1127 family)
MTDITLSRTETTERKTNLGPLAAMFRWVHRRYVTARAANELAALDDRMLADLGLDRSEINGAVRSARFR